MILIDDFADGRVLNCDSSTENVDELIVKKTLLLKKDGDFREEITIG